ncbi:MAG: hypothetical protein HRU34_03750 [Richelia sp.]|nr:hypothetical protein [Richelia sp.]
MFNDKFLSQFTHDFKQIQKDVNYIHQTFQNIRKELNQVDYYADKRIEGIKIDIHHELKNIFLKIINNQIQREAIAEFF